MGPQLVRGPDQGSTEARHQQKSVTRTISSVPNMLGTRIDTGPGTKLFWYQGYWIWSRDIFWYGVKILSTQQKQGVTSKKISCPGSSFFPDQAMWNRLKSSSFLSYIPLSPMARMYGGQARLSGSDWWGPPTAYSSFHIPFSSSYSSYSFYIPLLLLLLLPSLFSAGATKEDLQVISVSTNHLLTGLLQAEGWSVALTNITFLLQSLGPSLTSTINCSE